MSDFSSAGRDVFPNLYGDAMQIHDLVEWPKEAIEDRIRDYSDFLERKDLMPRARNEAGRLIGHYVFELMCREGAFDE